MEAKQEHHAPTSSHYWRSNRSLWLLSGLAGILSLSSCGTRHSALDRPTMAGGQPKHYGEVTTSTAMASSTPEVYDNGTTIKRKTLELIEQAEDYILVNSFLLSADAETMAVMEALKRKHEAGVRIYVLSDSCSRYMPAGRAAFHYLDDAGIPNTEHNPMRVHKIVVAPVMLDRDHRKFWIIDGKTLFLGGANLFSTSLRDPERNGNRDLMVAVESKDAIERMIESFVATWNHSSDNALSAKSFRARAKAGGETELWLSDQNKEAGQNKVVAKMFEGLFAVAQEEIWLIQPYTFVTSDMLNQFRELTNRGVAVNVMLSGKVQSPRFHYASHYGIQDILKTGAKVWLYRGENGPMHTKAIMVDQRWASLGSANFNSRSYHFSNEANLIFGDPKSVNRVRKSVDQLKRGCRQVGMEEAKNYRRADYYVTWLVMQFLG